LPRGTSLVGTIRSDVLPTARVFAIVNPAGPAIAEQFWGIDMSKARLHLILCSDDVVPDARRRRRDRGFHPCVIEGGRRTIGVPADNPWEALRELFGLGLLVSQASYLAFVGAGFAALAPYGWVDAKQAD
jgi:hypothetical protein